MGIRFEGLMRRLRSRSARIGSPGNAELTKEVSCAWYDDAYTKGATYYAHYTQSQYYPLWTVLVDRLHRGRVQRVLEVGCGPGQLAAFMLDQGVVQYTGFDFSRVAVAMAARKEMPNARFFLDDATTTSLFTEAEYDAIVCTEVLEHLAKDLLVVSRFRSGARCICTVPNFPYRSHVRHFESEAEAAKRYSRFFTHLNVCTVRRSDSASKAYYILDGIRNAEQE